MFGKRKKTCYTFAAVVGELGEIRSDEYFKNGNFLQRRESRFCVI